MLARSEFWPSTCYQCGTCRSRPGRRPACGDIRILRCRCMSGTRLCSRSSCRTSRSCQLVRSFAHRTSCKWRLLQLQPFNPAAGPASTGDNVTITCEFVLKVRGYNLLKRLVGDRTAFIFTDTLRFLKTTRVYAMRLRPGHIGHTPLSHVGVVAMWPAWALCRSSRPCLRLLVRDVGEDGLDGARRQRLRRRRALR